MLIKNIHRIVIITIFLHILIQSEMIIHNYADNNKGTAGNNVVRGQNNTWIGVQNRIDGKHNAVKGDTNKVSGNSNYVQGNGNVVGQLNPEELAALQNQMEEKMAARFGNMFSKFNFNTNRPKEKEKVKDISPITSQQQYFPKDSIQLSSLQKQKNNKTQQKVNSETFATNSQDQINTNSQRNSPQQAKKQQKKEENIQNNQVLTFQLQKGSINITHQPQLRIISNLIFHSYGNNVNMIQISDIFNRRDQFYDYCQRWQQCIPQTSFLKIKLHYSSIYPSFPINIQNY